MKNICDSTNLTQLITEPTRTTDNTKTLIDNAVTNRPSQILDSGVIPCGISDHDIIYRVSQKKGIDKKLLFGAAEGFNSQFLNLFGFSISVSFVWCII